MLAPFVISQRDLRLFFPALQQTAKLPSILLSCSVPQLQTGTACCWNKSCDLNHHCGPTVQTAPPPEEKRKLLPETSPSVFFPARLLSLVVSCGAQTKICHYRPKKASGGVKTMFLFCLQRKSTTSFFPLAPH